jgi:putative tryptophan/tyrosine transport system substrate-binding protein
MQRREVITLLGGAAAWPLTARAQQRGAARHIGVLLNGIATDVYRQSQLAALVQRLQELGWVDGQNIRVDVRWNAGDAELARIYAAQLIGLMPDVVLASSSTNLTAVQQATTTIPMVFVLVSDPLAQGFVASVTKPGGNITGFAQTEFSIGGKWLGLLKEVAPALARIAVMFNPETSPQSKFFVPAIESAASSLSLETVVLPVHATADIEPALTNFARQPNGGLILPTDTFTLLRAQLIAELALRQRVPTITGNTTSTQFGTLMYYGAAIENVLEQWRQAAGYIDRILKGARPGDLPIQSVDKYNLVINLKSAKALGLTVPPGLISTADEVIE